MNQPNIKSIAEKSISLLLQSMIQTEDNRPIIAETNIAKVILILNQIALIDKFDSPDLDEKFKYCRLILK